MRISLQNFKATGASSTCSSGAKQRTQPVNVTVKEREKALTSEDGEEMRSKREFVGRSDIPLANLEVSSLVGTFFNKKQIAGIKEDILQRFEPSLCRLTVVPKDPKNFKFSNIDNTQFNVVSGRHLLKPYKSWKRKRS